MRNYNVYLSGMAKGLEDKLFFLDHLNLNNFDRVVDFGCGGGTILQALANTGLELIGVDNDSYMRDVADKSVPKAKIYNTLTRDMLNERTILIFSSVLHEVEDDWFKLVNIIYGTGCTIVVRDMRYIAANHLIKREDLARLVEYAHPTYLADFIRHWGLETEKDMYHFLLKYTYVDNWALEVKENYFSFNYSALFSLGEVRYIDNYVLPFKREQVLRDFGIELKNPTHTKIILKVNKE